MKNTNDLAELVREALARRREERNGCFVHNAAAAELLEHGATAIPAIEAGVLEPGRLVPNDLTSVMVMYFRLVREFGLTSPNLQFLNRLPASHRLDALIGMGAAWGIKDSGLPALPAAFQQYAETALQIGSDKERRAAERILRHHGGPA
jgi:hypothetical protein